MNPLVKGRLPIPLGFLFRLIVPSILTMVSSTLIAQEEGQIILGTRPSPMEHYAAKELQRYLYQLSGTWLEIVTGAVEVRHPSFIIGQRHSHPIIKRLVADGHLLVAPNDPGPQGYVIKTVRYAGFPATVLAGSDDTGCLYAAYGLLSDHYHVGFFFSGDVLPEQKSPLKWLNVDERKAPAIAIRGLLPWSNFPQSSASYSWEDWKFIIDQMARMRLNLLHIHNYSGERGYNEMFANFTLDGYTARGAFATARSGHVWHGPSWQPSEYLFRAGDLFDDYDFGADCSLHNEGLSNEQVSRKGVSLFQKIIAYAHSRGVRVALGLDIDVIPTDYKRKAHEPRVIAARAEQISADYPDLDFLVCFQSEEVNKDEKFFGTWRNTFMGFYKAMKLRAPATRLAVSGWGLEPGSVAQLPRDVICAPIAKYSDQCESGAFYGEREYWGCPWLERDQVSSQYYYPYNMHLENTVAAYRKRAPNMTGFYALTWRLTDAIEPKIWFVSRAPWETSDRLASASSVYQSYAVLNYGRAAANQVARILNQGEPFASDFGECQGTAMFSAKPPGGLVESLFGTSSKAEYFKCLKQLAVVELCMARATSPGPRERLRRLYARLAAVRDHLLLNQNYSSYSWENLPGSFESWVGRFTGRVTDISSLGNVASVENRFVQYRYLTSMENEFRSRQPVKAPSRLEARGLPDGAVLTWRNEEPDAAGFYVYRNGTRLNAAPLSAAARIYTNRASGVFQFSVAAINSSNRESPHSVPATCEAGTADHAPPQIVLISPPASSLLGQDVWIKVRVLDNRAYEPISATLFYRTPAASKWRKLAMPRRTKAIFAASVSGKEITAAGLEYYVEASDGDNTARFPATAPLFPLSLVCCESSDTSRPDSPADVRISQKTIQWSRGTNVFWHRIYRGRDPVFVPGPANFVTYVSGDTTEFTDAANDFDGQELSGVRYYRLTAEDKAGNESLPSEPVSIQFTAEPASLRN